MKFLVRLSPVSVNASHLGRGLIPDIGVFTWFSVKIKEQVENISELDILVTDLGMNASLFSRCHQPARTLPCLFKILYTLLPAGVIFPVTAQRYWAGDEHALVWLGYTHGGFPSSNPVDFSLLNSTFGHGTLVALLAFFVTP